MNNTSFFSHLKHMKNLLVYGQEDYAARVCAYLDEITEKSLEYKCLTFLLQKDEPDQSAFQWDLYEVDLSNLDKSMPILIAFSVRYHDQAMKKLSDYGFTNLFFYTSELDNELKKVYFSKIFKGKNKEYRDVYQHQIKLDNKEATVEIYMSKCVVDKPLAKFPELSPFIIPIQAGAALTEKRIADVTDDSGDNISTKNRKYSEMTAVYWIWKHIQVDYIGLCHYRRHFFAVEKIVEKLQDHVIDAVLPIPTLCNQSVYEDYLLKHIPDVWKPMMDVLQESTPEYYLAAKQIYQEKCFYASNMWILKRHVLDDLCKWMFPILMKIEKRVGELPDPYYNRYTGFCAERLTTLYFLYNKNNWKIAHAEKIFIN